MAKSYHFLQGTNVVGPLSYDRLSMLVQNGIVSERTMLSDDASNWKQAIELVPKLFGKQTATSAASSGPAPGSGAERWYVQANGQQYGPVSFTELFGWVSSKSVVAETLIRKSEAGTWQRADTVFLHLGKGNVRPEPQAAAVANVQGAPPVANTKRTQKKQSADANNEDDQKLLASIGLGTVIFVVVGGYLLYNFVIEPQLKTALGPIGWCIAWLVFGLIRVSVMEGIKRNLK